MKLTYKNKQLDLSEPQIMGILNITPDSFSDGGKFNQFDMAMEHAQSMIMAGATIIDVGGESTRPGATEVAPEDELNRVIPLIKAIRANFDVWISLDTYKSSVMAAGIEAGVDLINDIRALQDEGALEIVAKANIPVCIMHMKGQPRTMQQDPQYNDVLQEVCDFLQQRIDLCLASGINKQNIIIDPGFGFGKTVENNYHLLANFKRFHQFGLPVLAGMSRKSMITKLLGKPTSDSMFGSVVCATLAAQQGAQIIRVHDVAATQDALRIIKAIQLNS
ncbi:dihydropteroate synthase [Vibrio sp. S17_S38]|uniref:dihydropteroate synthase n=1 Tax=Vibrio sp. S17_S38 TaxID=2720229 RepID=UPI0016816EE9|nr:dihydropteroate synthase [Vibrio sp. S17_S38]MBD1573686.1 dihydropteroate synthase [Vibrio sp. S17_S38]